MTTQDVLKTLRELRRETNDPWHEETYDKAIAALKKQIPKRAIKNDPIINPAWVETAMLCPECHSWAGSLGFCSKCGQAIELE